METLTPHADDSSADRAQYPSVEKVAEGAKWFLALATDEARWFQRRAESIDFSRDVTKRTTLVDLVLPHPPPAVVPVALRAKAAPAPVRVRDHRNRWVSLLTTEEAAEIVFTALVLAAEEEDAAPTPEEEDLLLTIVTGSAPTAEAAKEKLLALQPGWQSGRLRCLVDLASIGLPVFVFLGAGERRQGLELTYPAQSLTRHVRSSWWAAIAGFARGGITVGAEISSWPPVESTYAEFDAPALGEIASVRISDGEIPRGFLEILPRGSAAFISLEEPDAAKRPVVWLQMTLRRTLALAFAMVAFALVFTLLLIGSDRLPESADGVASAALLALPLSLAVRAVGDAVLNGDEVSTMLVRAPALLLTIAALAGLAGLALPNGAAAIAACSAGVSIAGFALYRLLSIATRIRAQQRAILAPPPRQAVPAGGARG